MLLYGLCEWQRRPERAVATRVCVLSGGEKKDDIGSSENTVRDSLLFLRVQNYPELAYYTCLLYTSPSPRDP